MYILLASQIGHLIGPVVVNRLGRALRSGCPFLPTFPTCVGQNGRTGCYVSGAPFKGCCTDVMDSAGNSDMLGQCMLEVRVSFTALERKKWFLSPFSKAYFQHKHTVTLAFFFYSKACF